MSNLIKLTVVKKGEFGEYVLENKKIQHSLNLEFFGVRQPEMGDVLIIPEHWLNTRSLNYVHSLCFELVKDKAIAEQYKEHIIGFNTKDKKYVLKRVYG